MEIRQLRYFVCAIEQGSMGKAARELGVVTSALSQQISRLESELSTRLLQRTAAGVAPTDAGIAFFRQAQLALRNIDEAARSAKQARLSGHVSVGLAPTTAAVLGLPLILAMRERYPDVRLHLVESLSGHLSAMLNARQLDLAILFDDDAGRKWSVMPLLEERLYVIAARGFKNFPRSKSVRLASLAGLPLAMPTRMHGLRGILASAVRRQAAGPEVAMEIDSLAMLMDAVAAGLVATIQPGAAITRMTGRDLAMAQISDRGLVRRNLLASLSDDELSPAGLAARVVVRDVARALVDGGQWIGARSLHES
ncbi:LysR family transcriptional regulator OS=Castellaniella sp OX=1955812 GN=EPN31_06000 PE=3 SV=1 [Castellaniella denitrificans]|uniref:LysR substrate-binding domain-containing protein n=1 Tax=Castellaniella sp. TaxID=1955812 RepID=UPI002AFECD82|nr:LysR substrate-binding domain-containing protein [Castellaniella sp.]